MTSSRAKGRFPLSQDWERVRVRVGWPELTGSSFQRVTLTPTLSRNRERELPVSYRIKVFSEQRAQGTQSNLSRKKKQRKMSFRIILFKFLISVRSVISAVRGR
jgi:hypothetical protein